MMNANAGNFEAHRQGYASDPYDAGGYATSAYPNQQQQLSYSTENPYSAYDQGAPNAAYPGEPGNLSGNDTVYYDQHGMDPSAASYTAGDWNAATGQPQDPSTLAMSTEPGFYYPNSAPITPRWGTTPITALAYDDACTALYAASATISNGRPPSSRCKAEAHQASYDRSAMLSTYSTNPTENGMLYASVAGHPEASRNALMDVYSCLYGFSGDSSNSTTASTSSGSSRSGHSHHIPSHAYKPAYGRTNSSTPGMDLATAMVRGAFAIGKNTFHMGINSLLPLSGYVASISPAAVRVHAHGGLQLADQAMEGMLCGTVHPDRSLDTNRQQQQQQQPPSHITVGGIMHGTNQRHQLHCLDVWRGLHVVSSRNIHDSDHDSSSSLPLGITAMATSQKRGSIVAGCSDGKIRFLDGSLREVAKIRGHASSVTDIAVSEDGMLIATTGYGYRPTGGASLYAFPEPNILLFDIRYLGRGGIAHSFSGLNGGPRFVSFIPSASESHPSGRLLAASGQNGGGMQIIVPFEPAENDIPANFMLPQLERGESISTMVVSEDDLALGTSQCRILQYKMAGYATVTSSGAAMGASAGYGKEFVVPSQTASPTRSPGAMKDTTRLSPRTKQPIEVPSYVPPRPALSLDPSLLQSDNPNVRNGMNDRIKSIFTAYTLAGEPTLTPLGGAAHNTSSFGPLTENPLLVPSRRLVSPQLTQHAVTSTDGDYLMTIPTASVEVDLLEDHSTKKPNKPRHNHKKVKKPAEPIPNPNKTIYAKKIAALCFQENQNRGHRSDDDRSRKGAGTLFQDENSQKGIPPRYRLTLRPSFKSGATFDHAEFNNTGLFPGWDYPPTMPNAFVSPVLLLLYFNPALRSAILRNQYNESLATPRQASIVPELSFLFHQMESLSRFAYSYPTSLPYQGPRVRAWVPTNFLASLTSTPEAQQLQILDGSPAAVDLPRRPEAFYLFLLYQIDKELSKIGEPKQLDSMHGTDFVSVNEFLTGSGETSQSTARAMTIELAYDCFREDTETVRFGQVLQRALCRDTRLRAWNQKSRSYETIVQRKIATSLPQILSLSCACAGRKEEDGLNRWRSTLRAEDHWLPEIIEVELSDGGGVVVKERGQAKGDEWQAFKESSEIPPTVSKLVMEKRAYATNRKYRYRLDAVVSFIRDDMDSNPDSVADVSGHHIVHVRVPKAYKKHLLSEQHKEAMSLGNADWSSSSMFMTEKNWDTKTFKERAEKVQNTLGALEEGDPATESSWLLANGYVVSDTVIEDARAFHVNFKEPCLVVYRALDDSPDQSCEASDIKPGATLGRPIPRDVMNTRSITDGRPPKYPVDIDNLPGPCDLIAFDAEFVSVQEEESTLTKSGSKVTLREVRHAVARISVIDCKTRKVIIDDHVLPQERVVDYLTRFSGIVARDLDPVQSLHHLISTRSAYLKLRLLMERGCIFVGHGLSQDFLMVNLVVPSQQVIDTVEIFHQERMRYISLRFLANYILGRDMQRDTHDSVEDAMAAFEIYLKALELKKNGQFTKALNDLYEHGRKTDWKLGVDASH